MTPQVSTMWSGRLVPNKPVGQDCPTKINASEPTKLDKHNNKCINIYVPQRTTWFQLHVIGTIGVPHTNPRKIRPQRIVGTPLHQWVLPRNVHRALSLLQCMDKINRRQKSVRHSLLQTKVHNKSNSDTWICGLPGSTTTHSGTQKKFDDRYIRKWNIPTQKLDAIFNTNTKKFWQLELHQNSKTRQKTPTLDSRFQEEPAQYTRVISETAPTHTFKKNTTIRDKSAKKQQSLNYISQDEDKVT